MSAGPQVSGQIYRADIVQFITILREYKCRPEKNLKKHKNSSKFKFPGIHMNYRNT